MTERTSAGARLAGRADPLWLAALLVLAGCAASFEPPPAPAARSQVPEDVATREAVLETALGQIGRPYRYGGGDGDGFDCSGLVQYVYSEAGIALPRTAAQQLRVGAPVKLSQAAPGDLVFFRIDGGMHVGIYVGDGRVVHAPAPGKEVTVAPVTTPYWRDHFIEAVRVLR